MKVNILILLIVLLFQTGFAQKYSIVSEGDNFGIDNEKGEIIVNKEYVGIYPCTANENFLILNKDDYLDLYLFNYLTKQKFQLSEYLQKFEIIDGKCEMPLNTFIRFTENKKIGLIQFPQTIVLQAQYSEIFPVYSDKNFFILCKGKENLVYNTAKKQLTESFNIYDFYRAFKIDDKAAYLKTIDFFPVKMKKKNYLMNLKSDKFEVENSKEFLLDRTYIDTISGNYYICDISGNYFWGVVSSGKLFQIPENYVTNNFMFDDPGSYVTPTPGNSIIYVKDNKYGLFELPDKNILDPKYENIYKVLEHEFYLLESGETKFLFNLKDKSLSEPFEFFGDNAVYVDESVTSEGLFCTKTEDVYFMRSLDGQKYPLEKMEEAEFNIFCSEGIFLTKENGLFGYRSSFGEIVIPAIYEDAGWFCPTNVTYAKINGKYGIIKTDGTEMLPFIFDKIEKFGDDGNFSISRNNLTATIEYQGNAIENLITKKNETGKYGYCTEKTGKLKINYQYDFAEEFSGVFATANIGGKYNNETQDCEGGKWGLIDLTGNKVVEFVYDNPIYFSEGLARVTKNGKWGFVDYYNNLIIDCIYDQVKNFDGGNAEVELDGNVFFINTKGENLSK
jgi:hypothetical protein